nr:M20/M25/M40 family metallo-hydrolase [Candidatus Aminicenantes bacterium]
GYGIEEADQGWNDLEGLNLEGKIAVMLADAPMRNGKPVLSDELHKKHTSIPGIVARVIQLAFKENGPKAIVVISNDVVDQAWQHIDNVLDQFTYALKIDVPDLLVSLAVDIIIIKRDIGKALFEGQVYNPIDSLDFDSEKYKCYELSGTDIKLELVYDEEDFVSWNVVGMVEGTNSELREQYITLGAHLDTVAKVKGQTVKGADDNASGSAGLIEIAEAVARSPFPRPMIFSLWTAEEGGAFGSQYFIQKPPVSLDNIKINVNLDMIGRSTPDNEETSTHLVEVFNTDIVAGLKKFIEEINSRTVKWPLLYVVNERLGGSSDHASFYKRNIPVIRFYSGHHDDVHLPSDDADKIDFEKMEKISKLTYWILKELAEADKIPDFEK